MIRWLPALLAGLALLLGACGGGDDSATNADDGREPSATATGGESPVATEGDGGDVDSGQGSVEAVDACSLITKDEAEAALGTAVGDGQSEDFSPLYSCRYETGEFESVNVSVLVYPDADTARDGYQLAIDINDYTEIEGIGDGAYFAPGFGVTAIQDKYEVTVDVLGPDDDQPLEEDLVRKALERLP